MEEEQLLAERYCDTGIIYKAYLLTNMIRITTSEGSEETVAASLPVSTLSRLVCQGFCTSKKVQAGGFSIEPTLNEKIIFTVQATNREHVLHRAFFLEIIHGLLRRK